MRELIKKRIAELNTDFAAGEARLARLEREAAQVRETLLRISGAIQVLQETLAASAATAEGAGLEVAAE